MSLLDLLKKSLKRLAPALIFCLSLLANQVKATSFYMFCFNCLDIETFEEIPVTLARTRLNPATLFETREILDIDTDRYKASRALQVVIGDFEGPLPRLNRQEGIELVTKPLSREAIEPKTQTLWLKVDDEEIPFDWAISEPSGWPIHPLKFGGRYHFFIASCWREISEEHFHYLTPYFTGVSSKIDFYGFYITIERY